MLLMVPFLVAAFLEPGSCFVSEELADAAGAANAVTRMTPGQEETHSRC